MTADARNRMIEGAATLLARKGFQAASFGEVVKLTRAPRGSIYHHFPEGKDEMIGEAVDLLGNKAFAPIEQYAGSSPDVVTAKVLEVWRAYLEKSELQAGCAILAVTVTATSASVIARAAEVFRSWRERIAALLKDGGLDGQEADEFAAMLVAGIEGATVLSRAEGSLATYDMVSKQLVKQVRSLMAVQTP